MAKALRVDIGKREFTLAKNLRNGYKWEWLNDREKMALYTCPLSLEGLVEPEKIEQFERRLGTRGTVDEQELESKIKQYTSQLVNQVKGALPT